MFSKNTAARPGSGCKVMNRAELTRRLVARTTGGEAIVAGIGFANFDLWGAGHRPLNFYMLGSMGLGIPIAHGVAIAQPGRKVFAIEGDGSLLMQLGGLSTIADRRPENLVIIIWDNGTYHITGGQPTGLAAAGGDFVALARASGLENAEWARDEDHFEALIDYTLSNTGPFFIAARIETLRPEVMTPRDPVQIRHAFMRGLGVRPPFGS